ncbi:MAG: formylglycine-generating enzyme family protein [Oligoflexia bacterium]|nr:formylglycine-generating enzyme family protein [Oligoflexia bacterium]
MPRFLVYLVILTFGHTFQVFSSSPAEIPAGSFTPLFGLDKNQKAFRVDAFLIDRTPVTNSEFNQFIKTHKDWRRSQKTSLVADQNYLKHWRADGPSIKQLHLPVTNVSWFAANDYCTWKGGRLPSTLEWEYVAAADSKKADASKDPEFTSKLLKWYEKPSGDENPRPVGANGENFYGVKDLHQLIWEWTYDFNATFVTADNRQDGDKMKNFFCGSGAINANSREDYAAFMRYAFRSSLGASFTVNNLGFRCAYDKKN